MKGKKGITIVLLCSAVVISYLLWPQKIVAPISNVVEFKKITLTFGTYSFLADVADTETLQARGLSGRASLSDSDAMIFVFPKLGNYSFWMKDMLIPIDMVWLDEKGRVVTIASNVSPETYPKSYTSTTKAQYVVELRANMANDIGLKVGDIITFDTKRFEN
jgi:hypothetical protein